MSFYNIRVDYNAEFSMGPSYRYCISGHDLSDVPDKLRDYIPNTSSRVFSSGEIREIQCHSVLISCGRSKNTSFSLGDDWLSTLIGDTNTKDTSNEPSDLYSNDMRRRRRQQQQQQRKKKKSRKNEHTKDRKNASSVDPAKQVVKLNDWEREKQRDHKGVVVVSKLIYSILQNELYTGVYYTFLMTHTLHRRKTSANNGYSTNPMLDVALHNKQMMNDRTTNAAAPWWVLDVVLGPFSCKGKAMRCNEEWVDGTRGKKSKRKKALFLMKIYDVNLYSRAVRPKIKCLDHLKNNAPPLYAHVYENLKETAIKKAEIF